eukprot:CAMPEP_0175165522 /NCGR_PEP_ID=MMETSP0087-20121206/27138_1 /TAXON_ID=136419 /ORGANISM="Unknown Unknown, Strain D1" /LENGTH=66 /DNA_ID=CAMNT_0016454919 /DNA_START=324 /DNA_END=521 /DNA_ORIENTATION=+
MCKSWVSRIRPQRSKSLFDSDFIDVEELGENLARSIPIPRNHFRSPSIACPTRKSDALMIALTTGT